MNKFLMTIVVSTMFSIFIVASQEYRKLPDSEPFVIGVYSISPVNDQTCALLKDVGVSYIHSYGTADPVKGKELLDMAQRHDMKVMLDLGSHRKIGKSKLENQDWQKPMQEYINSIAKHPALGMLYLWDEPATELLPEVEKLFQMATKSTNVPSSLVIHWRTNWENTRGKSDIWMTDLYPIRGHKFPEESPLDQVPRFHGTAARARLPNTQFIPVLQMCDFRCFASQAPAELRKQLRYPNPTELRFMANACLTYGVRGLFFFSHYHAHLNSTTGKEFFDKAFCPLVKEIRQLEERIPKLWEPSGHCYDFDMNNDVQCAVFLRPSGNFMVLANSSPKHRELSLRVTAVPYAPKTGTLVPFGQTRNIPASLRDGILSLHAEPWESFIWEIK